MDNFKISTICAIDSKDYETIDALNKAIRWTHKMKQEDYYNQFFPRKDLFTNQFIEFKSPEYYMSNLFNGRATMNSYLRDKNVDEIKDIVVKLLRMRIETKGIRQAPGELESKTITFPAISALLKRGINYHALCRFAGAECRYDYKSKIGIHPSHQFDLIIDSREQKPLNFKSDNVKTKIQKLEYGDYEDVNSIHPLTVERKSLNDYIGTLSRDYERFSRECARAREDGFGLVVLVESDLAKATSFNYSRGNFSKCDPKFVFSKMRDILREYPNVQFLFVDGREEAARVMLNLFGALETPMMFDLQYLYNTEQI